MNFLLALCLAAAPGLHEQKDWNRVVAALQLVGEEYLEALELPADASSARRRQLATLLEGAAPFAGDAGVRKEILALRDRVLTTDYELGVACKALVGRILDRFPVRRTPRKKPDLEEGKKLYVQACAACHGEGGKGGSPIASTMDPPPRDILNPRPNWSPSDMFNRVTYGGAETAMPAFKDGLSQMARWDIVFYLFAERWPPCEKPLPPLRADELAVLGDYELGNRFGYGAAACLRRIFRPPKAGAAGR
ncbi:MAG TPA: cytochrome c [Myxococcales bacterium]|jgi:mono/diheme cytochrome c family protein|nr:cytochrome c [Myxococcales bacterium]